MNNLQMVSVSSESSGQSGSPSQSQASGMQVSLSRQWNSPTSHEMASKMAWWKSKEKETKAVTWSDDHGQVDHVSDLKVCARYTYGWTCFEWMWWRGITLLVCTVHVHCTSFAYNNFVRTGCHPPPPSHHTHTHTPYPPSNPTHKRLSYQTEMTQTLQRHCDFDSFFPQRHDVLCALENYYRALSQVCSYLVASLVVCFHLMVGLEEFNESPAN